MVYTKHGPFVDASPTGPYIDAGYHNAVEAALVTATTQLTAPAPSGDTTGVTDQVALQPLVTQAQTTGGNLLLQPGTYYVTGLTTSGATFNQPRIRGAGMKYTTIVGTSGATAAAIRMKGGAGQANGGGVDEVTLSNPGGTALQLADVTATSHHSVRLSGAATGVQFLSESTNAFCEFNVCTDFDVSTTVTLPFRFSKTSGNESFHGSGIAGNTVINQDVTATGPVIQIDAGCLPYESPLTFTVFPRSASTAVIANNNGSTSNRQPLFFGTINVETSVANLTLVSSTGGNLNYCGNVLALGSTGLTMGKISFVEAAYYNNTAVQLRLRPYVFGAGTIGSSPSTIVPLTNGNGHLVDVVMVAASYMYRYLLYVTQNPASSGGNVSVLATQAIDNTAGYGAVTSWTVSSATLFAAGSGFPATGSPIGARTKVTVTGEYSLMQ